MVSSDLFGAVTFSCVFDFSSSKLVSRLTAATETIVVEVRCSTCASAKSYSPLVNVSVSKPQPQIISVYPSTIPNVIGTPVRISYKCVAFVPAVCLSITGLSMIQLRNVSGFGRSSVGTIDMTFTLREFVSNTAAQQSSSISLANSNCAGSQIAAKEGLILRTTFLLSLPFHVFS